MGKKKKTHVKNGIGLRGCKRGKCRGGNFQGEKFNHIFDVIKSHLKTDPYDPEFLTVNIFFQVIQIIVPAAQ